MADAALLRSHLARQIDHWTSASARLARLEDLAGPDAWGRIEQYLGVSLREHLRGVAERTMRRGAMLRASLAAATTSRELAAVRRDLLAFRRDYLRAETTLDFYADAINTRTNAVQGSLLRALDTIAHRAMAGILEPVGYPTPIALTYIDKGLGASILKAGLRLWDGGSVSAAAAIKIARHNLIRPTALVHEAGHQVAHIANWNGELAALYASRLPGSSAVAEIWSGWASEIAADTVAFAYTGYGSVLALHDVLAGESASVFQIVPGDPHPMAFLRIDLNIAMCRLAWGDGPWDELGGAMRDLYPIERASPTERALIAESTPLMQTIAALTLTTPARAFRGRSMADVVSPARVSPQALEGLEKQLGPALFTSSHWIWTECLRLLALSALRGTDRVSTAANGRSRSENWMLRLGGMQEAA